MLMAAEYCIVYCLYVRNTQCHHSCTSSQLCCTFNGCCRLASYRIYLVSSRVMKLHPCHIGKLLDVSVNTTSEVRNMYDPIKISSRFYESII